MREAVWGNGPVDKTETAPRIDFTLHLVPGMTTFAAEHADWLTIVQLPTYAPDLNPTEGIWSLIKRGALAKLAAADLPQFVRTIKRALKKIQYRPHLIDGCLPPTGLTTRTGGDITNQRSVAASQGGEGGRSGEPTADDNASRRHPGRARQGLIRQPRPESLSRRGGASASTSVLRISESPISGTRHMRRARPSPCGGATAQTSPQGRGQPKRDRFPDRDGK
ncbi:transposase [Microbispora sp. NPDC049125]|uniref:transposase n=1 Tax=Microbispora sp. NPDC049125 TaxID=3154929 RepID=UPI0034667128